MYNKVLYFILCLELISLISGRFSSSESETVANQSSATNVNAVSAQTPGIKPARPAKQSKFVMPEDRQILESNGIRSCQDRPLESITSNQALVQAHGKVITIYCDPNHTSLNRLIFEYCCYIPGQRVN